MTQPIPYTINIPSTALDTLHTKLTNATFPDELIPNQTTSTNTTNPTSTTAWDRGAPLADIKRITTYWRDEFDWLRAEAKMNELPNYRTEIEVEGFEPLGVHFVWQRSEVESAVPLLFVHGWPGSFLEVTKLLPLLKGDKDGPAFHVVAPSLPNFGFSEGPKKGGFGLAQYAEACHKLMLQLGYDKYVTQGGDWGMYTTRCIGLLYPSHCLASHINSFRADPPTFSTTPWQALKHALTPYSSFEHHGLARSDWFLTQGQAYRQLQGTKPQTVGYIFADSPVALLAWIYEKLHDWSDAYPWTDDEICTWISLYWFSSAGPAASVRIYYEATHQEFRTSKDGMAAYVPGVKLGISYFPQEIIIPPSTHARTMGPVVYEKCWDKGGHFAAYEQPQSIAKDLENMFGKDGCCAGIVPGKDGYKKRGLKL